MQRTNLSKVRVFIRLWKSIQSRIGKSFLHPTRAGSTFLRSCIVLITGIAWGQEDRWAKQLAKRLIVNGIKCWDTEKRGAIDLEVTREGFYLYSG